MKKYRGILLLTAALLGLITIDAAAQSTFTRILGPSDQEVVPPSDSLQAHKDAAGLQEILAFVHKTSMSGLIDIRATGSAALPAPEDQESVTAMLMAHGADRYRLDLRTAKGTRGIRIYGTVANMKDEKGMIRSVLPQTGASSTLVFARLGEADFSDNRVSVLDHGMVDIDGASLHYVSVQLPLALQSGNPLSKAHIVTDFYFDSNTHLLVKTADNIVLPDSAPATLLRVMTYGDYRTVNGVMVPFLYKQTLNGQLQWTVQLDQVTVNAGVDDSSFQFTK